MSQRTFQAALTRALEGRSQVEVAREAGIAPSTISTWLSGGGADPHRVFAVERALSMPPGDLSKHLGYLPVEDRDGDRPPDLKAAIEAAPDLDNLDKDAIRGLYNVLRRRSRSAASNTVSDAPANVARKASSSASR